MTTVASDRIQIGNINSPGRTERVNRAKYEAMRKVLLAILPGAGSPGNRSNDRKENTMRVMVIIKATKNSEAGAMPSEALELRPLFEVDAFGDEMTPELRDKQARLRADLQGWEDRSK